MVVEYGLNVLIQIYRTFFWKTGVKTAIAMVEYAISLFLDFVSGGSKGMDGNLLAFSLQMSIFP
ncbi:hypothetical protein [Flagellimonas baculiformis]|uniref:hypothetical protein n=1 Tax=Flagellimonas baculiformis TaxID=3067310 RepID=UPI00296FEDCD|nr:hypothetical protein [Muricauda sp. D6]